MNCSCSNSVWMFSTCILGIIIYIYESKELLESPCKRTVIRDRYVKAQFMLNTNTIRTRSKMPALTLWLTSWQLDKPKSTPSPGGTQFIKPKPKEHAGNSFHKKKWRRQKSALFGSLVNFFFFAPTQILIWNRYIN